MYVSLRKIKNASVEHECYLDALQGLELYKQERDNKYDSRAT